MGRDLEKKIWLYSLIIMFIGLVVLYSASYNNVRVGQKVFFDQLGFAGIGIVIMYVLGRIDYRKFYDSAYFLYALNVFVLFLVLVTGRQALGASRWIDIAGISFQPSEFMKLTLILMLGRYFSRRRVNLSFSFLSKTQLIIRDFIFPFTLTLIPMFLIFKQPDLGTALLLFGIFFIMLFVGGIGYRYILSFFIFCLCFSPLAWHILKPYQRDRLLVFLNPDKDPLGAGYTIIQSKIAIGSGQLFGKGWLAGTQSQLNFLPERHTDFIFSVVGEEWGLMGTLLVLAMYFLLIHTAINIAEQIKDRFGVYVCIGIAAILALQAIINIGMVMGLFPIVGITLPFISYGRSSFFVCVFMMGFLLSLSKR
ncbi:MAG: rod shape-determining protein RodA [Candidatus Omnitrophica bacterium]|nr:rod shape-determining protein RodA [Candidatus Omnitrophota bacterium]